MPFDLELEDGTVIEDVPDDVTSEQLEQLRAQHARQPNLFESISRPISAAVGEVVGGLETAANVGVNAVAQPIAGLAGIGAGLIPGGMSANEAVQSVNQTASSVFPASSPQAQRNLGLLGDAGTFLQERVQDFNDTTNIISVPGIGGIGPKISEIPLAAAAVETGLLGGPSVLGAKGVSRPFTPRQQLIRDAQQQGFSIPPSQINGSTVANVLEGAAGKPRVKNQAAIQNQPLINAKAREAVGMKPETDISRETLAGIRAEAHQAYRDIRSAGEITTDVKFRKDLSDAIASPKKARADFPELNLLDDDVIKAVKAVQRETFDADSGVTAVIALREAADQAFDAKRASAGRVYRQAADAIDNAMDRSLIRGGQSDLVNRYRAARERIAKTYTIEDSLVGTDVSGPKLAAAARAGRPLDANLQLIARLADEFPGAMRTIKDTVPVFSAVDVGSATSSGIGALATGNPGLGLLAAGIAARPLIRAGLLSRPGQALFGPNRARTNLLGTELLNTDND